MRALASSSRFPVHRLLRAGEGDEAVPLHRRLPSDSTLGLADLLTDAAQRAPGPVSPILVVDRLLHLLAGRPARPRLGQDQPVRRLLTGVGVHPVAHDVGNVGDLLPHDEPQPRPGQSSEVPIGQHARVGDHGHLG